MTNKGNRDKPTVRKKRTGATKKRSERAAKTKPPTHQRPSRKRARNSPRSKSPETAPEQIPGQGPKHRRPTTGKNKRTRSKKRRRTGPDPSEPRRERVQKVLSRAGLGARRRIEDAIEAGRVRINARPARLGDRVGEGDKIVFDGAEYRVVAERAAHETLVYHKPEGEVTTRSDPEGRATVFDRLPQPAAGRWIAIGRLDLNTAGLLLLTTDGELAHRMMHPAGRVDREYVCRIRGRLDDSDLQRLLAGVELDDGKAAFSDLVIGEQTAGHTWYTVTIMEGRNREVRRLWEAVGARVARLKRVRFGPVFLPDDLRPGHYRKLTAADHRVLREDVGLTSRARELVLKRA